MIFNLNNFVIFLMYDEYTKLKQTHLKRLFKWFLNNIQD